METEIEFVEDLPSVHNRPPSNEYKEFASKLKKTPGMWAVLKRFDRGEPAHRAFSLAYSIRQGKKGFGEGFEASVRQVDGQSVLFVRAKKK